MESWLRLETACNIIFIRKTVDIVEGRIVFVDVMEGFGYHLTTRGKGWNISGVRLWFCKPSL